MRTIDADALLEKICRLYPSHPAHLSPTIDAQMFGFCNGVSNALFEVDRAPTVDAEPVRHARWLPTNDDNKKRCSRCDVIHLIAQYPHGQANYCPNCGAKMDAEVLNGKMD